MLCAPLSVINIAVARPLVAHCCFILKLAALNDVMLIRGRGLAQVRADLNLESTFNKQDRAKCFESY